MNAPRYDNRWNLTTVMVVVNMALLIFGGGMAYATLRAGQDGLAATDLRHESAMDDLREAGIAREVRLRAVELGAGRTETKLEAIEAAVTRIEARLQELIDRGGRVSP